MMIAKRVKQNQTKHAGFTEFYRNAAGERGRQILPAAKNLPLFVKIVANSTQQCRQKPIS
jgi:hypothetical protein